MKHKCSKLILFLLCLSLVSCSSPPKPIQSLLTAPLDSEEYADLKHIRQITDQILVILAGRQFQSLEQFIDPDDTHTTGPMAAAKLLGPDYRTVILVRWNAQNIQVSIETDLRQASSQAPVYYRTRPNRKPALTTVTFHFSRNSTSADWKLILSK
jgi:hypothetical protein